MQIFANLGRVIASDSVLPTLDEFALEESCGLLVLRTTADLHWRRREWSLAIDLATRVLLKTPNDFHALTILANSYSHLGQMEHAYPHAKRLLHAKRPNWNTVKVLCGILGIFNLLRPKKRQSFYNAQRRCNEEAQSDRENIMWAEELIKKYEPANDSA
jgi:tetratricopeptide (TPR) repeat protein